MGGFLGFSNYSNLTHKRDGVSSPNKEERQKYDTLQSISDKLKVVWMCDETLF